VLPGAAALPGWNRSIPYHESNDDGDGPPIGYTTRAYYQVPRDIDAAAVIRFFRSRLEPLGWQVSMRTAARRSWVADFRRDGSVVTVDAVTDRLRGGGWS